MACCAFALLLLGQIAAGIAAFRRAVPFGLLGRPSLEAPLNPATAWRLGAPALALPTPRLRVGRAVAAAALLELSLLGGAALWALHDAHAAAHANGDSTAHDTLWCWSTNP